MTWHKVADTGSPARAWPEISTYFLLYLHRGSSAEGKGNGQGQRGPRRLIASDQSAQPSPAAAMRSSLPAAPSLELWQSSQSLLHHVRLWPRSTSSSTSIWIRFHFRFLQRPRAPRRHQRMHTSTRMSPISVRCTARMRTHAHYSLHVTATCSNRHRHMYQAYQTLVEPTMVASEQRKSEIGTLTLDPSVAPVMCQCFLFAAP
jgi:hypothetical protein